MAIQFVCPNCRGTVAAPELLQGRRGQCPYCRQVTVVPLASAKAPTLAISSLRRPTKTIVAVAICVIVVGAIAGLFLYSVGNRSPKQTAFRGKPPPPAASAAGPSATPRSSMASTPAQPQGSGVTPKPGGLGAGYGQTPASPTVATTVQPPPSPSLAVSPGSPPAFPGNPSDPGPAAPPAKPLLAENVAGDWETDIHEIINFTASGSVVQSGTFRFAADPKSVEGTMSDFRFTGDQLELRWRYRNQSGPGYVARRGDDQLVLNLWSETTVAMTPYSPSPSPYSGSSPGSAASSTRNRRLGVNRSAAPAAANNRYGVGTSAPRVIATGGTGTEYALRRRAPAFEVTSLKPNSGQPGQSLEARIQGKGFEVGATCELGDGMDVSTTFLGGTSLQIRIAVAKDASAGFRHLRVVNSAGREALLRNAFRVLPSGEVTRSSAAPASVVEDTPMEDVWSGLWETASREGVFLTRSDREVSGRWLSGEGTFQGEITSAGGVRGTFEKDGRTGQMTLLLDAGKRSARLVLDYGPNDKMTFQLKRTESR